MVMLNAQFFVNVCSIGVTLSSGISGAVGTGWRWWCAHMCGFACVRFLLLFHSISWLYIHFLSFNGQLIHACIGINVTDKKEILQSSRRNEITHTDRQERCTYYFCKLANVLNTFTSHTHTYIYATFPILGEHFCRNFSRPRFPCYPRIFPVLL